MFTEVYIVCC